METWDDFESSEDEFEEEKANMARMASTKASESELYSDSKELFSHLTRCELELSLAEILEKSQRLKY